MAKAKDDKALILVSGGPDSATLAYAAEKNRKEHGGAVHALFLKTGASSDTKELEAAAKVAERIGSKLEVIDIRDVVEKLGAKRILMHTGAPLVSLGSTIAFSIAAAYAVEHDFNKVLIGMHKDDSEHGPQYTRNFLQSFEHVLRIGRAKVEIEAPFLDKTKPEVFSFGQTLGVDFSITWSCINSGPLHCGICGACIARHCAFLLADVNDPTSYLQKPQFENANGPFFREQAVMAM